MNAPPCGVSDDEIHAVAYFLSRAR